MKVLIVGLMALAIATPVLAVDVQNPPARYDYEPRVPYTIIEVSAPMINKACGFELTLARIKARASGGDPDSLYVLGCTLLEENIIMILRGLDPTTYTDVVRHEKAHINGWRH